MAKETKEKIEEVKPVAKAKTAVKKETVTSHLTLDVLDMEGKKIGTADLNTEIFDKPASASLLAQALRVFQFNQRQGTVGVKTRADVRGGGKKPWRQKGTGRARQGSIRSPQWKGGGVVHGPIMKDWSLELNKKQRRAALLGALTLKAKEKEIVLLKDLDIKDGKTKVANSLLKALPLETKSILVVLPEPNEMVLRSMKNLAKTNVEVVTNLNTAQVIGSKKLLLTKAVLSKMEDLWLKKEN